MAGRRRTEPPAHRPLNTSRAQQRRLQLLEIGARHFVTQAFDEVSMDALADEAGVSHGLIYQYFGSKLGLYEAVVAEAITRVNSALAAELDLPPRQALRAGLREVVRIATSEAGAWRLATRGALNDKRLEDQVERGRQDAIELVLGLAGISRPNNTLRLGMRAWVGMIEAAVDAWASRRAPGIDEVVELLSAALDAVLISSGHGPLTD